MDNQIRCSRCNVPMTRQPDHLDLSWAGDGPNAADVDFQGILVEVFHCPACRGVATRPVTITLSSRGLTWRRRCDVGEQRPLPEGEGQTMKAIAVFPRKPGSVHLAELPKPSLSEVPGGRGVLIRVLRCGVDGTDKEINAGDYGAPPPGYDFLVLGHENFGRVEAVGENVTEVAPGDYVVATVRRPGMSLYDAIGTSDMTTDDSYFEHGINLLHGFLTEYSVEDADFVVKVPQGLKDVAVLLEPLTVAEKGITQAYEIQRRLRVWRPRRAAVMGAGTIGLLATLILRLRGMAVTTFGLTPRPYLNSDLLEELGARYVSTKETPLLEEATQSGPMTSSSRRPGSPRWSSRACGRWERTESSSSRASPEAAAKSRSRRTGSIWISCSATR